VPYGYTVETMSILTFLDSIPL